LHTDKLTTTNTNLFQEWGGQSRG